MFENSYKAEQVEMILGALSIRMDYLHCIAVATTIDNECQIVASREIHFTDGSMLAPNRRGTYIPNPPVYQPGRRLDFSS